MKRFFVLTLLAVLISGIATAQNANRSGFFLEAGIGGLVGNTPRTSIFSTDNVLYYKTLSGAAVVLGFGGRFRIGNHWAYELKIDIQSPLSSPLNNMIGRFLPVSFRYTSTEIYRNYSLYAHMNLGASIVGNRGIIEWDSFDNETFYPNTPDKELNGFNGGVGIGPAYSLGIGVNITTHVYVEAFCNGQAIIGAYGKNGNEIINYGLVGILAGYRF